MTVRLGVGIMAHPSRAAEVDELVGHLDREPVVTWDQRNDRWDTGRRALLSWHDWPGEPPTHWLVVQDDAIPCRDLVAGVERAISHAPLPGDGFRGAAVSLYIGAVRPYAGRVTRVVQAAHAANVSWVQMVELHWGVAFALPVGIIDRLVADQDRRTSIAEYDRRVSRWLASHKVPVWYSWPSLVDHRDTESLVGHGSGRHAHHFAGADVSALDLDWTGPVVVLDQPAVRRRMVPGQFPRRSPAPVVVERP